MINAKKITVIGCGRWGSFLAWYAARLGHTVTLYGRSGSRHMQQLLKTRRNELLTLPENVRLSEDLQCAADSDIIMISIDSQGLRALMRQLRDELKPVGKTFVLCMKGLEISTGKRLSEIAAEYVGEQNKIAIWLGPGHVQEFTRGIMNCMVIDSDDPNAKEDLIRAFSGDLIRFYYGNDMIGNEIGAAAKNVIGIAAGMLDGKHLSSLKGALMSRGTREVARLIVAMGGNELSAYGLCHLGDYEATVFSPYSHNRAYGEAFVRGEAYVQLAEGVYTVQALVRLGEKYHVELPICSAVYRILFENYPPTEAMRDLFLREQKPEF